MNGNSDELTRAYLDRYAIEWRHLNACEATTECGLFGRTLKTPVMAGGMAHYDGLRAGGAPLFAEGVKAAGSAMWTGFCSDEEMEAVIATGVPAARIIKPFADKKRILDAIRHDEQAGAAAFSMDVDHVFDKQGHIYKFFDAPLAPQQTEDLAEYAASTSLPFFVKGILSVRDALICAEAGVAGIVISHHQNMFPWSVPPLAVLPEIKAAVGDKLTILLDCGLSDGYDIFKALALGADGVFVARPLRPIFAEKGPEGVCEHLNALTDTLRACLARTASPDIRHIDPAVLHLL